MSSVYTNEAAMELLVAGDGGRLTMLLDLDEDGDADTGVLDAAISDAGVQIDARLAQRYPTPFAQITDSPTTPPIIQLIAKHLTAAILYERIQPDGEDAKAHYAVAYGLLDKILGGTYTIPGVDPLEGDESATSISYSADEPQFSGRDSTGSRRWRGM
jgi:phage gp36-like protein